MTSGQGERNHAQKLSKICTIKDKPQTQKISATCITDKGFIFRLQNSCLSVRKRQTNSKMGKGYNSYFT